jgi:hypothetical protein
MCGMASRCCRASRYAATEAIPRDWRVAVWIRGDAGRYCSVAHRTGVHDRGRMCIGSCDSQSKAVARRVQLGGRDRAAGSRVKWPVTLSWGTASLAHHVECVKLR